MATPKLVVSVQDVKDELSGGGMCEYLSALDNSDQVIAKRILEAQRGIEHALEILFFQQKICTRPVTKGLVRGQDYDKTEDGYPFRRADFSAFASIQLRKRPVQNVWRAGIRYGNESTYIAVLDFPNGWINQQARLGVLEVQAIVGGGSMGPTDSLLILPMLSGAVSGGGVMPLIFSCDYTAGFLPSDFDPETDDLDEACPDYNIYELARAVRMQATAHMLRSVRRSVGAGGGSIAMEGLSQSWDSSRFSEEIKDYEEQVKEILENFSFLDSPFQAFFA